MLAHSDCVVVDVASVSFDSFFILHVTRESSARKLARPPVVENNETLKRRCKAEVGVVVEEFKVRWVALLLLDGPVQWLGCW